MNGNDFYNILDEPPQPPMTLAELRERLKHIAVCCAGLSIDLANEITLREQLRRELKAVPSHRKQTEAQREKHRQRMREYWARKKAEKAKNA